MAGLEDIPFELLLQIAGYLKGDNDALRHLALTSRWFLSAAQEALYQEIIVEKTYDRDHPRTKTLVQTSYLFRTLFARPDFCRKVRALRLHVLEWETSHSADCVETQHHETEPGLEWKCSCDFAKIQDLCVQAVQGTEMRLWLTKMTPYPAIPRRKRYQQYRGWLKDIHYEYQPALVAVLLHILPSLESLSLKTHNVSGKALTTLLGVGNMQGNFSSRLVPGLSALQSLTTTFLPPWTVMTLPTLHTLHIKTGDIDTIGGTDYHPVDVSPGEPMDHSHVCTNITTLILDLNVTVLTRNLNLYEGELYGLLHNLLSHLDALRHLEIRLFHNDDMSHHTDIDEGEVLSYGDLMPLLQVPTLETLTIDTSDVDWEKYADNGTGQAYELWQADGIEPLDLPSHGWRYLVPDLMHLRRLVLPQEALFFHYRTDSRYDFQLDQENFLPCLLPPSIEIVEVIDSTRMLNHWAKYVLMHRHQFPSLKQVVLWCDRLPTPLIQDQRFRQETPNGEESEESDDNREYKLEDDVDDEVWGALQGIGVELVINTTRGRNWRVAG
ncbi:hypothetical protein P153DRAFT_368788 [Dothidotthia symphoricarpi CBS 119687]|uniref:F-box domain-containing protein n=1 Tax=Dothidotthia symphoricarpi CBS 119687 TaxID=1392245 RepID=A0A6A6A6B9_9PLEO|nr:uncharacterized protein P153DRAFT_368788 [Dothidotthia symphoricarpi CBS 119687]KAF2126725.1 hypothetical protein P153DRAFT_368788 [Dothidotthia symphoricarpi CBS 119687]